MGTLVMSEKERQRKVFLEMVLLKKLTLKKAAKQLGCSYRHVKRLYQRYQQGGDKSLVHQHRGRLSNRRHVQRQQIIARYQTRYEGFGPTLAAEKLAEDDKLYVDHETLRRWLLQEGLWSKQRRRSPYRQRRERRAQFGELVQLDGSIHDWLEEGRHKCLMNMVDDATGKTLARLESGETTAAVFRILWAWIERYGIPLALYVDLKTVYVSVKQAEGFTHVARACARLGIEIKKAYSAQAKGRVERNHAVYQDRFVKELRLQNIKDEAAANELLANGFIDKLNERFEKPARISSSAHRCAEGVDLQQTLCWEYERQVQNDWTFSFQGQYYQIKKQPALLPRAKQTITIRQHLDNTISVWFKEKNLNVVAIDKPIKISLVKKGYDTQKISQQARLNKHKTPWGQFNPGWLKNKKSQRTEASQVT
jgi:transposase